MKKKLSLETERIFGFITNSQWLRLVIFLGIKRMDRKRMYMNKIAKMKMNDCSCSNFSKNDFVFYSSEKKGMGMNERQKNISCEW